MTKNKSLVQEYAEVKWGYRMEISEYVSRCLYEEHIEREPESVLENILGETSEGVWEDI